MEPVDSSRRPLAVRSRAWAINSAAWLARHRIAPNAISLISVLCGMVAGACFVATSETWSNWIRSLLFIGAAGCVQLRLICNLLDGMVAIEWKRQTATGGIYNDLPDRIADVLVLVGAGYAARPEPHALELAWLCASLALLTAYIRTLGQSLGSPAIFIGPMAKQHRMAAVTLSALLAAVAVFWSRSSDVMWLMLIVVSLGTLVTCIRRTVAIAKHLERR